MWFTKGTCRPFSVRGVAWSASMGEADGMSLKIIIGLLCTSTHTTIPFWWNCVAAVWEHNPLCDLLYCPLRRLYRVGTRTEPWGTAACITRGVDSSPSNITLNFLLEKNELISLIKLDEKCNSDSLYSKPGCHVVSNAFSISKKTAAVDILLLKFKVTWSVSLMHWNVVLWHARKPNWHAFRMLLSSMFLWTLLWMTFQIVGPLWMGDLWGSGFEVILGPYLVLVKSSLLLPSKTMENAKAVSKG